VDKRYRLALDAAVADLTQDPVVVGILFTGSVQQGRPAPTSDLDLYVITHHDHYFRATREYEGVQTELFFNNVAAMHWRLTRQDDVVAMSGFATGQLLLDRTGETAELIELARQRWDDGPPTPTPDQIKLLRYRLQDLYDDLIDVEQDPVASRLVGGALVAQALEVFCKLNRHWGDKAKRLADYVAQRDPVLGSLVNDYFARTMHPKQAYAIVDYVLASVGGRLRLWESAKVPYTGGTPT
ncbi:MAG: nucleotidyltransferase, partial [Firmicutes bacterium]|nr:nucleotidyltransferase [Bacillota bacterium]